MTVPHPKVLRNQPRDGIVETPGRWSQRRANSPQGSASNRLASRGRLLSDDRLHWLEYVLDEAFHLPGTEIRFGLDGVIGLVPGLGDVVAACLSLFIPLAAWIRGVPYITLLRMLANVLIGLFVGTIPVLGDAFDIFWKANRRNYHLLTLHIAEPRHHTRKDWAFLLILGLIITGIFAIPYSSLGGWSLNLPPGSPSTKPVAAKCGGVPPKANHLALQSKETFPHEASAFNPPERQVGA